MNADCFCASLFGLLNSAMNLKIEVTVESVYDVLRQPPASLASLLPEVFDKLLQPAKQTHRFMEVYTVRPTPLHSKQVPWHLI